MKQPTLRINGPFDCTWLVGQLYALGYIRDPYKTAHEGIAEVQQRLRFMDYNGYLTIIQGKYLSLPCDSPGGILVNSPTHMIAYLKAQAK